MRSMRAQKVSRSARGRWVEMAILVGPAVAWAVLVSGASSSGGASGNTESLLLQGLRSLSPRFAASLTAWQIEALNYAVRKSAHFVEYAVLMCLTLRAFQFGFQRLRLRSVLASSLAVSLFAAGDEVHQWFVPGRSASAADVLIDVCGAGAGLLACATLFVMKRLERSLAGEGTGVVDT